jgi:RimJ/RimL family protein N-acetyltransferase
LPDPLRIAVPEAIETERLLLRAFRESDAPALHEALVESLPALRQHLGFLPWVAEEQTLESALARCRRAAGNFLLRLDLPYLAFSRSTGRLVGSIGLHRTDWNVPRTEVGYWIRTSELGHGYATEGVRALTGWALRDVAEGGLGAQRVELVTDDRNQASRAVAERCGFALEGLLRNTMRDPDGSLSNSCVYARVPGEG